MDPAHGRPVGAGADAFLLGSVAVQPAAALFYVDFVCGLPNSVDALLGTVGVPGREGGPLGFLSWGQIASAGANEGYRHPRSIVRRRTRGERAGSCRRC
jgi:hypothetical protein